MCGDSRTDSAWEAWTANYALERSVTGSSERAARVQRDFTLAARWHGLRAAAQRGRYVPT